MHGVLAPIISDHLQQQQTLLLRSTTELLVKGAPPRDLVLKWRRKWSSHLDGLVFNVTATYGNHHSCLKFANCPAPLLLLLQMDEASC